MVEQVIKRAVAEVVVQVELEWLLYKVLPQEQLTLVVMLEVIMVEQGNGMEEEEEPVE